MCACTEGSRCGHATIGQAQRADVGVILYLKRLFSFSLYPSLSRARARSLSVSVPLSMCTYANVYLGHLTLEPLVGVSTEV